MNKEQAMQKLNEIFIDLFDDDSIVIKNETTADDIEDWDSLAHLQLISNIEKEFKIHFTLGEITSFKNVGELCDCVIKHLEQVS